MGDAVVDAPCVAGFLDLCSQTVQPMTLNITNGQTIKTDSDSRCHTYTQASGGDVCLIYVTSVTITGGGLLTVTGSRPLALASSSTMRIDGMIDVGSHGGQRGPAADDAACMFAGNPASDTGGGGGAAGGTFTLAGGNGGIGDKNDNGPPTGTATAGTHGATTTISVLRGGCPGQAGGDEGGGSNGRGGAGGHSGGGLYLYARQSLTITATGRVRATGAGGAGGEVLAGGGGGGTGGLVVLESPSLTISGQISANGGGGGQGGGLSGPQHDKLTSGNGGRDGDLGTTAAAGGSGAGGNDPGFGPGGAGGALTAAVDGTTADFGGGGGGGAAGVIKLLSGQQQVSGTLSPVPQ